MEIRDRFVSGSMFLSVVGKLQSGAGPHDLSASLSQIEAVSSSKSSSEGSQEATAPAPSLSGFSTSPDHWLIFPALPLL
jgi:hypothetical protein